MPSLQQTGNFRGSITSYALNEAESGAVSVKLECSISEIWYDGQWCDYSEHGLTVGGDVWIIKKDGTVNDRQVQSLVKYAGWDGSLESITDGSWFPSQVAFVVEEDEYNGTVRYRIKWVNDFNREPGGGNVDASKAKELQQRFGSQFRAIAGNAARNDHQPTGSPKKAPPKSSSPQPPAPIPDDSGEDDVPF